MENIINVLFEQFSARADGATALDDAHSQLCRAINSEIPHGTTIDMLDKHVRQSEKQAFYNGFRCAMNLVQELKSGGVQ